ncbi:MAG: acyl-CoA dehydratase activase [Thermoanaerobaculales bacterium]|jgi:predicted CoA-substrate-specific enzyme activase|nr:acyl-CoA dehydratase activase [Thermoanaerobaculales bacterium]
MRVVGLDIGSRTVKRVIVEDGEMTDHLVVLNNHDPLAVCDELLAGQPADRVVATGYGRHLFAEHRGAETLTEIRAVALGARRVCPNARTLLDIGGQDTKVIALDARGAVAKFEMNDRCAAGTGRFLEVMATALSYPMADFVRAGRGATGARTINAMCTVFAESEVISATARGADRAELARGLHEAVVRRAVAMLRRLPLEDEIVFCGGGALNACLRELISEALGREVHAPPAPQIVAALGAALSVEG